MKYFIYDFTFIPHGLIRTHKWPAPNVSGFKAQLVWASHRYREVTGSNPVEVLIFSGFCIRNCINCVNNCEDHSLHKWVPCSIYVYVRWEFVDFPHRFAEQVYCSVLSTTFVSRRLKYISNGIHPTYAHRPFYSRVLSCLAYEWK